MILSDELSFEDAPEEIRRALRGRVPTVQQWEAITHPLTPCAVIAGAGSGKTAVMAARVVYLVLANQGRVPADHGGSLPSQILCLTFTNKATEELARRVRTATEGLGLPEGEEATVLTYHSFAASIVEDYGIRIGVEPGPMLLSEAHKWQLVASLLAEREFEHLEVRTTGRVVEQTLALADACANHLADPEEVGRVSLELAEHTEVRRPADRDMRDSALKRAELAGMVAAYTRRKRDLGVIDYGDQIALATQLVDRHPEVAEEFRARFAVVLLDEYQDTNFAQARLLSRLCGPEYPVFAVGDPDQNIYAWRGATLANVLRFSKEFGGTTPAPERPLYVNFRSGSRILAVADEVIGKVPAERRGKDKVLRPHPERGEGRVAAFVAIDERAEARQIAEMIKAEVSRVGGEPKWDRFAILCRKRRLFGAIAEILREEDIPAEVVDLGGLLHLPEVVDVLVWLRLLENPADNVSLARILQGPRWRIGYRDLVTLARWSAERNRGLAVDLEEDRSPGDVRFALVEALDHVAEIDGLSPEARDRLIEFRAELAHLRATAHGPLGDLVGEIAERTGLLRELEASRSPTSESARRNLLNLVEHVSAFSPVEGEASLSTLVEFLDTAEGGEDELEPVQLSDANTVKLLTIHKAKGLEWDVVFVPGLAEHKRSGSSMFPDVSRQPNPVRQPATLPFELRGDAEDLPRYERNIRRFVQELQDRGLEEERRLCYVALTRARDLLVVSAAHWYEGPQEAYQPGRFFDEIAGHEACETLFISEPPESNPLVALRGERARSWPGPGARDEADELFPDGWHGVLVDAAADRDSIDRRARELPPVEVAEFRERLSSHLERAALIEERMTVEAPLPVPTTVSVSSVLDYLRCPKLFYWSQVRPLPRRPSEAARRGSEVHRWIEQRSRGQVSLLEIDDLPDLSTDERLGEPGAVERMRENFRASRFAEATPLFAERPFLLYLDGVVIGGRVDAIFDAGEGGWEIVDYKSGQIPSSEDPLTGLQLDVYALAAVEVWGKRPEDLTLTYFYLAEGKEVSRSAGDPEETRKRVLAALSRMAMGEFEPTPGPQCRWCDFLTVCEAGQRFVRERV